MNTTFVIIFSAFAIATLVYFAHFSLRAFAICFAVSVVCTAFAVSLLAFLL